MVAAYVDDVVCAGCLDEWQPSKTRIEVAEVEVAGKYFGRDQGIKEAAEGKTLLMSMAEYCDNNAFRN